MQNVFILMLGHSLINLVYITIVKIITDQIRQSQDKRKQNACQDLVFEISNVCYFRKTFCNSVSCLITKVHAVAMFT